MSLFAPLLPSSVRVAERFGPVGDRGGQLVAGRALAAVALRDPTVVIPRGQRGAPLWPAGVAGSITHTQGYAAVAVAVGGTFASLGIDAEPVAVVPREAVSVVTAPVEQADLSRVAGDHAALLAFVAKEAVFKAWWPLTGCELDFAEVTLSVAAQSAGEAGGQPAGAGVLRATRNGSAALATGTPRCSQGRGATPASAATGERGREPGMPWQVRWRMVDGLMLAAVAVPAR